MDFSSKLHEYLSSGSFNFEKIRTFLEFTALRYSIDRPNRYLIKEIYESEKPEEWKEQVLDFLLKEGVDLNNVGSSDGQSPLCFVLWEGADVCDIELLLRKGASLNACRKHSSPLLCLTDGYSGVTLKANVVQLIIDHQSRAGQALEVGLEPLQDALGYCRYETAAIKLLLEHLDANAVDAWIQQTSDVLHMLVKNPNCRASIIELFLERGACISKLNAHGETPLHSAMRWDISYIHDPSVIECLLKNGAPVNVVSQRGETPLSLAVERKKGNYVINLLLAFGARFDVSCNQNMLSYVISKMLPFLGANYQNGIYLLEIALDQHKCDDDQTDVFQTLVKYSFLENQYLNVQRLITGHWDYERLSVFAGKCNNELEIMKSKNVRPGCTLLKFTSEKFWPDVKTDQEKNNANDDFNQLLKILSSNQFPEYFDIIASKIAASKMGRVLLKENLQDLIVYAVGHCPVKACLIKKIVLDYDCVCKLAVFLSDMELLCLIIAFYHVDESHLQ